MVYSTLESEQVMFLVPLHGLLGLFLLQRDHVFTFADMLPGTAWHSHVLFATMARPVWVCLI